MEAFSSLKFWQDSAAGNDVRTTVDVRNRAPESQVDGDHDDDSFFELVLTGPEREVSCQEDKRVDRIFAKESSGNEVGDKVYGENYIRIETPFKPKAVGSSCKPQSPISLLKSAPKIRVLFLGFKKSKPEKAAAADGVTTAASQKHQLHKSPETVRSKRFAVECGVEEVQIASLFSRDNSLRSKLQCERNSDFPSGISSRRSPKDFPKYLKLIKPFYIRASKRYTENSRLSSDLCSTDSPWSSPATISSISPRKFMEEKRSNRTVGFRGLSKHLGKSRTAASAVRMTPSPSSRRDDSLLLQHDGIQSAILHCKRSLYNASSQEYSPLRRSASDPVNGKSEIPACNASGEQMRCTSI